MSYNLQRLSQKIGITILDVNQHKQLIQQDTAQCVKCGACLPHCPTYGLSQEEGESPRGRLALMQGFASGALNLTEALTKHIDSCLVCRRCESVCPSGVAFSRAMDNTRAILPTTKLPKLLQAICNTSWMSGVCGFFIWFYHLIGLQALLRFTGILRLLKLNRLETLIPPQTRFKFLPRITATIKLHQDQTLNQQKNETIAEQYTNTSQVQLFTGCVTRAIDRRTIYAAIKILRAWGYTVEVPSAQLCCGAVALHSGHQQLAQRLSLRNIKVFKQSQAPIITLASGCGATLMEYEQLNPNENLEKWHKRPHDICAFLETHTPTQPLNFRPLLKSALLHLPCTLQNVMHQQHHVLKLLQLIPKLQIITMPSQQACCGAAGLNMLQKPDTADQLLCKLLSNCIEKPDYLLTSNVGCAMHFHRYFQQNQWPTLVMHPIELLASQINT